MDSERRKSQIKTVVEIIFHEKKAYDTSKPFPKEVEEQLGYATYKSRPPKGKRRV